MIPTILLVGFLLISNGHARVLRTKRQIAQQLDQLFGDDSGVWDRETFSPIDNRGLLLKQQLAAPFTSPVNLPFNHQVYSYPVRPTKSVLYPHYPFVHNANVGLDVNPATRFGLGGGFSVPLENPATGWYQKVRLFKGDLGVGPPNVQMNFGESVTPLNPLDIPMNGIYPALVGLESPYYPYSAPNLLLPNPAEVQIRETPNPDPTYLFQNVNGQ